MRRSIMVVAVIAAVAAGVTIPLVLLSGAANQQQLPTGAPDAGTPVCGQPVLDSPWSYDGAEGTFTTSGSPAGLPTFGLAGTDFPSATRVVVVPAGNNSSAANSGAWNVSHTIFYFEPGRHVIRGAYLGNHSAYVGGYTSALGGAVLDGVNGGTADGDGGSPLGQSTSGVLDADLYFEYLTIRNFASSQNEAVVGDENGASFDDGNVYKYDTIGPNEYGYAGSGVPPRIGESSGGGYGIGFGSNTTIEYDCLTRNAQGGFNGGALNDNISNNEISWNGLGEYPDIPGAGGSPYSCGCSGGGKLFFSVDADFVNNYVHDNFNAGVWFDFDNDGADISHNYIASNWGSGIEYESSYNADISDNTLAGNGWASDGAWPAGVGGRTCAGEVSCTNGLGPVTGAGGGFPFSALYLPNSGGNSNLGTINVPSSYAVPGCSSNCGVASRYSGELLVEGNVLRDNFGGVMVYTDTDRFPGNVDSDSACSIPLGLLNQANSAIYYQQSQVLQTAASDAILSGNSVTSAAGTSTLCADYHDKSAGDSPGGSTQPPAVGMGVFDMNSGKFLGTVASVRSANAFTLNRSPGNETHARLMISAYGGCGPADYLGGGLGKTSGNPPADYWDNCIWGSRNVTISENFFSMNADMVAGCTVQNECGYMATMAFNAGVPRLMQIFDSYPAYIAKASGGLGNVWSDNTYQWSGSGPGQWQFEAGIQGTHVTRSQWRAIPYGQDAGSRFNGQN